MRIAGLCFKAILLANCFSCDSITKEDLNSSPNLKVETVIINKNKLLDLQARFELFERDRPQDKKNETAYAHASASRFVFLNRERPVFQFNSADDYEILLSATAISHEIGEKSIHFIHT